MMHFYVELYNGIEKLNSSTSGNNYNNKLIAVPCFFF